jgi:hypothetical protein
MSSGSTTPKKTLSNFFSQSCVIQKPINNHEYQLNFLHSKFIAMKEMDLDKLDYQPKSTLQFSNSFVYTNFYETEREHNELVNLVSEF